MTESTQERSALSDSAARTTIVAWRPSGIFETTDVTALADLARDPTARIWVDSVAPTPEAVRTIASSLDLHHLIAEDIAERNQRSKIETFGELVHIVLFAMAYEGEVRTAEIDFVLGERILVSVHGVEWEPREALPLKMGLEPVLGRGTDYLLYALADSIVDGYFPVLDRLGDEIDDLQDRVLSSASEWTLQRLFVIKRELLEVRRSTSPAREIFNQLTNREVGPIAEDHVVYFRDVYDHLIRVTDELDSYRELVAGTLEMYLTIVNNDLSRIMKRLTGVTVILAGIGAIAGVFGMSEAGSAISGGEAGGFWVVTAGVVALAVVAAILLRRFDWI
jgi:magnesium transporter